MARDFHPELAKLFAEVTCRDPVNRCKAAVNFLGIEDDPDLARFAAGLILHVMCRIQEAENTAPQDTQDPQTFRQAMLVLVDRERLRRAG